MMASRIQTNILFILILNFSLNAQNKILYFNIMHNDNLVGTLEAKKEINGEKIIFTDQIVISTRILTKIEIEYKYEAIYSNNALTESNVVIMLNGHQKTKTTTDRDNNIYTFYKNDTKENKIDQIIQYSTIMLLFEEPNNISKVYA